VLIGDDQGQKQAKTAIIGVEIRVFSSPFAQLRRKRGLGRDNGNPPIQRVVSLRRRFT
jgi:hypothetical protein